MKSLFYMLFILNVCISYGYAQNQLEISKEKNFWINATIGMVGGSSYPGPIGEFSLEVSGKRNIYSVQYFGVTDGSELLLFTKYSSLGLLNSDRKSLNGINFLYGKMLRDNYSIASYSFGLSIIEFYHHKRVNDISEDIYKYKIGLPLSAQIVFTPIQLIAIGLKGHINLNTENSFMGASIGLYFGKVK